MQASKQKLCHAYGGLRTRDAAQLAHPAVHSGAWRKTLVHPEMPDLYF
jgi:hypothetical protein